MSGRFRSDMGHALQERVGRAFRDLRSEGFFVVQDVPGQNWRSSEHRNPYKRLMRDLRNALAHSDTARKRENARKYRDTGVVYYTYDDSSNLGHFVPSLQINFARCTIRTEKKDTYGQTYDYDRQTFGLPVDEIAARVTAALVKHDLVLQQVDSYPDEDYGRAIVTGVTTAVLDAAEAAKALGGHDARTEVLNPEREARKERARIKKQMLRAMNK